MRRPLAPAAALLALLIAGPAAAQPAPAGTLPVTPDPAECGIAPREADEIAELAPAAATPGAGTPVPPVAAVGAPADPATIAFVNAIVREALACGNAAGFPGVASLLTDAALTRDALAAGADGATTPQALTFVGDAPPAEERRSLLDVRDVRTLADGRVAALVVVADPTRSPAETPFAVVLAEAAAGTGGSGQYLYLIDALTPAPAALATPVPGTPAP